MVIALALCHAEHSTMSASAPLLPSVAKELPDTARDAYAAATEDVQTRLTRRLPPLVLTLCI